ncbi:MAG TPA: DsbA family protein [Paucimonas sp.]|nr:DsbA family protein [Paucimonas sp.]
MAAPIDFYFDFTSPYGYLAATQIERLAATYGRNVKWHPILLGVVFKATGAVPLTSVPMKAEYTLRDLERTARFIGVPYRHPSTFPIATQATARAMLWIADTHGEAKAAEFAKAAYRALFADGVNIGDAAETAKIAAGLDVDPEALGAALASAEVKERLKAEVEQAMARGVFGSPFVIVDGEPFWGFDHFPQIEALLRNGKI